MTRIIGVRFRNVGKVYYFSPNDFDIYTGDHVIVETARGVEYGTVVLSPRDVEDNKVVQPLKEVIRVATPEDDEQESVNRKKEREAYSICLQKIREHNLDMKLIDAEYTFDNNKVLFYFTADGRIDFRELVKDLAAVFKTRIELRQIGVRDETKILGGIGICGRPLCCHTYLSEFAPVSIKMAKEQNLSLNPTKISGTCGRLMCCLKNEQETYEYLNKKLPGIGDTALTPEGLKGEVQSVNVLRQLVKLLVESDDGELELKDFKVEELKFIARKKDKQKKDQEKEIDPTLMAELESLEENPEDAEAFLRAVRRGYEYAAEHPEEAASILCEQVPELDPELIVASQTWLSAQYVADASSWGIIDAERWNAFYKWLNDNGLVECEIPMDYGFTNDYLE